MQVIALKENWQKILKLVIMSERTCTRCGEIKELDLFVKHKQCREGRAHYCRSCDSLQTSHLRRETKLKAIKYKGGKCARCNEMYPPAVYDFHHLDATTKDADPGALMGRKWEKVKEELDKCILLCSNCHRMTHAEEEWK